MHITTVLLQVQAATPNQVHAAADEFVRMDPYGIGMVTISMIVVFSVLAIIYFIYKMLSKFMVSQALKKSQATAVNNVSKEVVKANELSAEASAAIAMALHLYNSSQHDMDSLTLTIQKVSRMYSPWSSKIYTLRQLPR